MVKDSEHPFFRPLWRRIAVVALCLFWAGIEFATGTPFWGMIALGAAAYGVWQFLPPTSREGDAAPPAPADPKE